VDAQVRRVEALVATHRASVNRLAAVAAASGRALFSGGSFYLCRGEGAWTNEGNGRAGGPMALTLAKAVSQVTPKDVAWLSYNASTYAAAAAAAQAPRGAVVAGFGPKPAGGDPAFPAGTNAAWMVAPMARQTDFSAYGDLVVNQHWAFGDGAAAAPGYDVPILPPSGVAQLFIYELLGRAISGG
jgi:hypothetical protein